ncbi:hypothetical protein A6M14_05710 [Acinetobacter sp. Ac_877]|nr:hypothetical protein [Acinetobacter portensis]
MKYYIIGILSIVFVLGFLVYRDIEEKRHQEIKQLIDSAKYSINNIEKNKHYYIPNKQRDRVVEPY